MPVQMHAAGLFHVISRYVFYFSVQYAQLMQDGKSDVHTVQNVVSRFRVVSTYDFVNWAFAFPESHLCKAFVSRNALFNGDFHGIVHFEIV